MKLQDIRRLYTEQVASLLAQGYTLYPDTMSGSQGEIAHIDLSNGSEILRVLLHEESDFGGDTYNGHTVITVGKCTDEIREGRYSTIWNNHLEVRSEIRLAKITDSWFTTDEDSRLAARKAVQPLEAPRHTQAPRPRRRFQIGRPALAEKTAGDEDLQAGTHRMDAAGHQQPRRDTL